jgi:hypothetical protein
MPAEAGRRARGDMDIGDMDVEDFQRAWRQARNAWDRVHQHKLETEASGLRLTEPEQASWLAAKAAFEEHERAWDQMYQMGVAVVVGGDDEDDL